MKEKKIKSKRTPAIPFSEEFKRNVIEEYLRSGIPKLELQRKYGIKFKSAIVTWMKTLGYQDVHRNISNLVVIKATDLPKKFKSSLPASSEQMLELEVKLLKRQLEDERLRSEMLNRMVDLAEKTYKIPVRKNSNTK